MKTSKVLLIDDEIAFLMNTSETLRLIGYEVSVAGNGAQGLRAIRNNPYDVVVLDLVMPGIPGLDVLKEIKTESKGSPEVIILTGYSTVESSLEGLSKGAFDYLPKPIKIRELVERITEAHERKILKDTVPARC
jgi:two-component system, OmpR family, response regulator